MFKSVCVLSALALLGACSHQQPKKVSKPYQVSKSFLDVIKTKKPGKPEVDKRFPASAKSIPGLPEFMVALKANPSFLKAPVGYEVVKENSGVYEGESYKSVDKSVYLKENLDGHFVLETYDGSESVEFGLYESQRVEGVEQDIVSQGTIKSFRKISATSFVMTFDFPESSGFKGTCQMALDLTKSSEIQDNSCKDPSGVIVSETKIVSVKSIKLEDYASALKSIKLEVYPNALDCGMITVEGGEEPTCFDSVKDGEEKNWSYILK
jgi:hypothetical protein